MKSSHYLFGGVATIALVAALSLLPPSSIAQQAAPAATIAIGEKDIGGVVASSKGPEAGVWVIAETTDLPTKFSRTVVTDDQGRYVIPDLPKANFKVWARGYGLVDSPKTESAPGKVVNIAATLAPNAAAAAEYYPAVYWFSMLHIPEKSLFPGTGDKGNGMSANMKDQGEWLDIVKTDGCNTCHALGTKGTRTLPKELGEFKSSAEAWERRIQSGQASNNMVRAIGRLDAPRAFKLFGDWTDRIAAGELPSEQPKRPEGEERNVVVSQWDWAGPHNYLHDEISTDKRNPTINPNGKLYGSPEESTDFVPILDPVNFAKDQVKAPVRDPKTPTTQTNDLYAPSPYWGDERIWDSQTNIHNPMLDEKSRVWFTHRIRPPTTPEFCRAGSEHPSAKLFPIQASGRQLSMYDPTTKKFTLINTCFGTHNLQFAEDANQTVWTSGGGEVIGWLNRKMFEETGDEVKSQGWTAVVLDTNGNGKRDEGYNEPGKPVDPTKDTRMPVAFYGVSPSPVDNSVWGSVLGFPGGLVRLSPGDNPPATALSEFFQVPWKDERVSVNGYSPRGMDIDRNGVVWAPLASGHLASFDRRKCKGPMNGPTATGKHCPEGWTLYPLPGPQFKDVKDSGSAEAPYYTWVDQHNATGLGANTPFITGNLNESIIAFKDGKMLNLRVPYPMGFYAKGMDARVDDPNGGWKGRGLWTTWGTRAVFHGEGGKGEQPKVVKIQMRPDPLAR